MDRDRAGQFTAEADNVIAVRLDSSQTPTLRPGNSNPDFQYHGGLYRDVKIHVTDPLHVTDAVYANQVAGGGVFVTYPPSPASRRTVNRANGCIEREWQRPKARR